MQIVNWGIVKHPLNWLTVLLMLFIAAIAGTLILEAFGIRPKTDDSGDDGGTYGNITGAAAYAIGSKNTAGPGPHPTVSVNPTPGISDASLVQVYG